MTLLDGILIGVYFAAVIAIAIRFAGRQKSTEEYFLAGRSLPGWVVAFSLIGTMIGSTSFVGHPGAVFDEDMWNLPFFILLPVSLLFVARFVVPLYRKRIRMSVYEYLQRRFGYPARAYGGAAFVLSRIVDVAGTLYFLAIAVAYLTGMSTWWVILVIGILTILYTLVGGIAAVAWTDVLQTILLLGGALVVLGVAWLGAPGGVTAVASEAWNGGRFGIGETSFSLHERNAWLLLVGGVIWAFQRYACDQHMVQRYLTARTDREAVRATYIGGVACLPIWIMFMLIGAGIWGYFQLSSVSLPAELTNDQIVPWFIRNECPQGMLGLIVAALMAAAMSSLAADMNSLATVVVDDFFAKIKPAATDHAKLWVGRVIVVLTGLAAVYFSQQWIGVESAMKLVVDLLLITTGGILGLFALGLLTTRATNIGAWIGIAACILFTSWATLTSLRLPSMDGPVLDLGALNWAFETSLIGILGHFILFGVGFVASLVLGRVNPDVHELTIRGQGSGEAAGSS